MNKYGLTQHYYNKTSFLDLTSNVETAKFFATTEYNRDTDSYFPIHDSSDLGVIFCYELQMPGAMTRRNDNYSLSVIGKLKSKTPPLGKRERSPALIYLYL